MKESIKLEWNLSSKFYLAKERGDPIQLTSRAEYLGVYITPSMAKNSSICHPDRFQIQIVFD